jgi:hypothetical protein
MPFLLIIELRKRQRQVGNVMKVTSRTHPCKAAGYVQLHPFTNFVQRKFRGKRGVITASGSDRIKNANRNRQDLAIYCHREK